MVKNKMFLAAIGNPEFQKSLRDVRELSGLMSDASEIDKTNLRLAILRAADFCTIYDLAFEPGRILHDVRAATGDELVIILGTYEGEIPGYCYAG